MGTAADILKAYSKECFKGKNKKIYITIREVRKDLQDIKIKDEGKTGNTQIRVHTSDEKAPPWFVHAYTIPLPNLGIDDIKNKKATEDLLNDPKSISETETSSLLKKLIKDYGSIKMDGTRNKLKFKTERFKKQKDYFKVKRKAL